MALQFNHKEYGSLVGSGSYQFRHYTQNPPVGKLPIGGRIFYDAGDNGATYKFYDASGNELTDQTVTGLATAVSYTVTGTPSKDR